MIWPSGTCLVVGAALVGTLGGCGARNRAPAAPDPSPAGPSARVSPSAEDAPSAPELFVARGGFVFSDACVALDPSKWRLPYPLSGEPLERSLPPHTELLAIEPGRSCRVRSPTRVAITLRSAVRPGETTTCEAWTGESDCAGGFAALGPNVQSEYAARGPGASGSFIAGFPYAEPAPPKPLPPMPDFGDDYEMRDQWVMEHEGGPASPPPPEPRRLEVRGADVVVMQGPRSMEVREGDEVAFTAPTYASYFFSLGAVFYAALGDGSLLRLKPGPVVRVVEAWTIEQEEPKPDARMLDTQ